MDALLHRESEAGAASSVVGAEGEEGSQGGATSDSEEGIERRATLVR
jgi:hypothetical protein